jgi:hypothetical protein
MGASQLGKKNCRGSLWLPIRVRQERDVCVTQRLRQPTTYLQRWDTPFFILTLVP